MVLVRFSFLEIDSVQACEVTHVRQVHVNDVQYLSRVIAKRFLKQGSIDNHLATKDVVGLLVKLLTIEFDWPELPMVHLIDPPLILVKLELVFLDA